MPWTDGFSDGPVKGIGALEALGALGLILPAALGIAEVLTPLAAVGLTLLMAGAALTHLRRKKGKQVPVNVLLGGRARPVPRRHALQPQPVLARQHATRPPGCAPPLPQEICHVHRRHRSNRPPRPPHRRSTAEPRRPRCPDRRHRPSRRDPRRPRHPRRHRPPRRLQRAASLRAAFAGAEALLLVSSSEVGQRARQHANAIDAAKDAGVSRLPPTHLRVHSQAQSDPGDALLSVDPCVTCACNVAKATHPRVHSHRQNAPGYALEGRL